MVGELKRGLGQQQRMVCAAQGATNASATASSHGFLVVQQRLDQCVVGLV